MLEYPQQLLQINDIHYAIQWVLYKLQKQAIQTKILNYHRHAVITCSDGEKLYLLIKRDSFLTWGKWFPQLSQRFDIHRVDSINLLDSKGDAVFYKIQDMIGDNGKIIIVYADKSIAIIPFNEWLQRANAYGLYRMVKRLKFGRDINFSGKDIHIQEKTISCYFLKDEVIL